MRLRSIHESFGSFVYKIPDDKELRLYDFFMIDIISLPPQQRDGEMDAVDMITNAVAETKQTLLPALRRDLLDAVYFSMAAEMRHVFVMTDNLGMLLFKYEPEKIEAVLSPEHFEMYSRYATEYKKHHDALNGDDSQVPKYREPSNKDLISNADRMVAFGVAEHAADGDRRKFVEFAHAVFQTGSWASHFGGKAWATIAAAWLKLDSAKNLGDMAVWIDHIYDLQHNTGSVFNKLDSYAKSGRFTWLKDALDRKFNAKDPRALIKLVSPQMRMLASAAIKAAGGGTVQAYEEQEEAREKAKKQELYNSDHEFDLPESVYDLEHEYDYDSELPAEKPKSKRTR